MEWNKFCFCFCFVFLDFSIEELIFIAHYPFVMRSDFIIRCDWVCLWTQQQQQKKWAKKQKRLNIHRNHIEIFKSSLRHHKRKWRRWKKNSNHHWIIRGESGKFTNDARFMLLILSNRIQISWITSICIIWCIVCIPCNVCQLPYAIWKKKKQLGLILIRLKRRRRKKNQLKKSIRIAKFRFFCLLFFCELSQITDSIP